MSVEPSLVVGLGVVVIVLIVVFGLGVVVVVLIVVVIGSLVVVVGFVVVVDIVGFRVVVFYALGSVGSFTNGMLAVAGALNTSRAMSLN